MKRKTAKHLLRVSSLLLLLAVARPLVAAEGDLEKLSQQVQQLTAKQEKTFDDLVQLALLNRKLGDEKRYTKWLAAAAAKKPEAAFTSERSPFVYVKCWQMESPGRASYLAARDAHGAFYCSTGRGNYMVGVDIIDPLTRDVRQVQMHEHKAIQAPGMEADYDGNFYLANYGIIFCFNASGEYLGQVVATYRQLYQGGITQYHPLPNGDFLLNDHLNHLRRINRNADTLLMGEVDCRPGSTAVCFDADKNAMMYMALSQENAVVIIDAEFNERCRVGSTGIGPAQSLAVVSVDASNGNFILADGLRPNLQIFDKNGLYLMKIPALAYSAAINDAGTILALENEKAVCYARYYKDDRSAADQEFNTYLQAVELMEKDAVAEGRKLLEPLTQSGDANMATVAKSLMDHDTLARKRDFERPRVLTEEELARLIAQPVEQVYFDPYSRSQWATLKDGFVVRVDQFEHVEKFSEFVRLYSLAGDLHVSDMRILPDWCYAATNHGICRYSRKGDDWQFLPYAKSLDEVTAAR